MRRRYKHWRRKTRPTDDDLRLNFKYSYPSHPILSSLISFPISSRLVSSRLVSSHLVSSRLVSSRLVSSRLVSSHLISPLLSSPHLTSPLLILPHLTSSHLIPSPHPILSYPLDCLTSYQTIYNHILFRKTKTAKNASQLSKLSLTER